MRGFPLTSPSRSLSPCGRPSRAQHLEDLSKGLRKSFKFLKFFKKIFFKNFIIVEMVLKRRIIFPFFATPFPVGGKHFALCALCGLRMVTLGDWTLLSEKRPITRSPHPARTESRGCALPAPSLRWATSILVLVFEINLADPLGPRVLSVGAASRWDPRKPCF